MALRTLVSKAKRRFVDPENGFDLDLSYITDQIIAMGFPSIGKEAYYRNPVGEVKRFFETRHAGNYKIYNLCSERDYGGIEDVFPRCERFPFPDHNAPDINILMPFCESVHTWLTASKEHIVGIHCKAGKGRTGVMTCCYLLYAGIAKSAVTALRIFGTRRTHNGKGVTIPSQQRYIWYFEQMLLRKMPRLLSPITPTYKLIFVRLVTVPNFDFQTGCDPYFTIAITNSALWYSEMYDYRDHVPKIRHAKLKEKHVDFDISLHNVFIRDNVKISFADKDYGKEDDHMFDVTFHTAFIESNYLCFEKSVLDGACKDKTSRKFDPAFVLELFFLPVTPESKWATEDGYNTMLAVHSAVALKERPQVEVLSQPALTSVAGLASDGSESIRDVREHLVGSSLHSLGPLTDARGYRTSAVPLHTPGVGETRTMDASAGSPSLASPGMPAHMRVRAAPHLRGSRTAPPPPPRDSTPTYRS